MPLVDELRKIGLPMGSWYERWYVGWTTAEHKAVRAEELGALVRPYTSRDERFSGYEVVCRREPDTGGEPA